MQNGDAAAPLTPQYHWSMPLPLRHITFIAMLAALLLYGAGGAITHAQPDSYTTALHPGFNLVGWTDDARPVEALFADLPQIDAVYAWEASAKRFRVARRDAPAFLNDLQTLEPGSGFWFEVDAAGPISWERQRFTPAPPLGLVAGANLLTWTGPDDVPVAEALASIGASLAAASTFQTESERFRTFSPSLPAALNELRTLSYGDAVWVSTCRTATWDVAGVTGLVATLPCAQLTGQPTFEFDPGLSGETVALIEEAIRDARSYFLINHALDISGFTVRAFADVDTLVDRWVALRGGSRAAAEQRWSGFAAAFGDRGSIWISAGGAGWAVGSDNARHSAVVHEYFHVVQFQLGASRGPEWLLEGSARYAEFVIAAAVGRESLDARRTTERSRAQGTSEPLEAMQTLAGLNAVGFTAGYSNGFLATEMLSGVADLAAVLDFYRGTVTLAWPDAFLQAFSSDLAAFYDAYASERAAVFPPLA